MARLKIWDSANNTWQYVDSTVGATSILSSSYTLTASYALNSVGNVISTSYASSSLSSSYALSASWAPGAVGSYVPYTGATSDVDLNTYALSASNAVSVGPDAPSSPKTGKLWYDTDDNTNAPLINSSSYALTASYALNGGTGGTTLTTGSTYPITSSWSTNSISSSTSLTASYFNQLWLETGSNYPITSSWSDNSNISNTSLYSSQSQFSVSSSFASSSISSSFANTASYFDQRWLNTGSTYPITSSWSENSTSASYYNQLWLETGSNYPITSSWAISASWAPSNSSIVDGGSYNISSSWASGSISSSYTLTASYSLNGGTGPSLETGSSYPITSSWSVSASWAPGGSPSGPTPIQASFDGQGFVLTSGSISYKPISTSGTYTKFVTICDVTGSVIYKIDKFTPTTSSFGSPTSLGYITLTNQLYTSSIVSWSVTDADIVTISLSGSITGITKTSIIIS